MRYWYANVPPLTYEDGKTQEDLVRKIIELFKRNKKFVVLNAKTGTGKSLIALNVIKYLGRGIVVVPTKPLQKQYYESYYRGSIRIKNFEISIILGRANFTCRYIKKVTCAYRNLPCTKKIEKNEKRYEIAMKCRYWIGRGYKDLGDSFINKMDNYGFDFKTYESIDGSICYIFFRDNNICDYYKQFFSYLHCDCIVMNSALFKIECLKGLLPKVDVLVIDEFDYFFDNLIEALTFRYDDYEKISERLNLSHLDKVKLKSIFELLVDGDYTIFLEKLYDFLELFENNYAYTLKDRVATYIEMWDYVSVTKDKNKVKFILTTPTRLIDRLFKNFEYVLLMSATPISKKVLKSFYNISAAEVKGVSKVPGTVFLLKPEKLYKITYNNWYQVKPKVERMIETFIELAKNLKLRTIIITHAKRYVEDVCKKLDIPFDNANNNYLEMFLRGTINIVATTRGTRGLDLKGDLARFIIIPKMPFPDLKESVYGMLMNTINKEVARDLYLDATFRTLEQEIGRGLRHKKDWIVLATPDKYVYEFVKRRGIYNIREISISGMKELYVSS